MTGYGIMWKTVSEDCNLACDYCYYSRILGKPTEVRRPTTAVLEKVLRDYLATCGATASIAWQGGEPLLAGLPFFRQVVALEQRYAHPPQVLSNAVQTNGILITQAWAEFFREYRFLVGVSLDGPEGLHDGHRIDARGQGSFRRVRRGIEWLERVGVEFNILTVVGPDNVHHGRELLEYFQAEGFRWIQFLPQMGFLSQDPESPGRYAITPEEYGAFLCETFDVWYNHGRPRLSIRYFDNVLQTYVGLTPNLCTVQAKCPPHLVLESNGDIYPCDFYLDAEWRLGNIADMDLGAAFDTPGYARFAAMKPSLPDKCRACPWLKHCRGGCPRNRTGDGREAFEPDYFCSAFETFFAYAHDRLEALAAPIRKDRARHALAGIGGRSSGPSADPPRARTGLVEPRPDKEESHASEHCLHHERRSRGARD